MWKIYLSQDKIKLQENGQKKEEEELKKIKTEEKWMKKPKEIERVQWKKE